MRTLICWLAAALLLSGCGKSGTGSVPPPVEVRITLAGGRAEPNGRRVDLVRGQHLVLTVTSDRADQVHVHGFDAEIEVEPGVTTSAEIVMDKVGRFEVESHDPVFTLLVLQVR